MTDGFFDIILFAMVAAFLVLRLRSVLGRRTGTEQRRDPFTPKPAVENVVSLGDRSKAGDPTAAPGSPGSVAAGIAAIRTGDPGFDPDAFLRGARQAFEMIVGFFAAGDTARLRPLLSDEVYEPFAEAIRTRVAQHETHETNLVAIKSADIVDAQLNGTNALVTVRIVSDQTNATRAHDNSIVDGDPDRVVEKTDFWTFARNVRSPDPNWLLVATRSA